MKNLKKIGLILIYFCLIFTFISCDEKTKSKDGTAAKEKSNDVKAEDGSEKAVEKPKPITPDAVGYAFGVILAKGVKDSGIELNPKKLIKGYKAAISDSFEKEGFDEAEKILQQAYQQAYEKTIARKADESKKFLEENKSKEGVIVTESGLQYKVLKEGDGGEHPQTTDIVEVNYVGKLMDGSVFDESTKAGKPVEIALDRVIPGWTEGIQLMTKGAKYKFFIPPALAYGQQGISQRGTTIIPPNEVLTFEVELVSIKKVEKETTKE